MERANYVHGLHPTVPPNTRFQPTAFGARDRWFFEGILCGALAAAERQAVGPRTINVVGIIQVCLMYTSVMSGNCLPAGIDGCTRGT